MRLHHLAVEVRDLARSEAFYAGVLGLPVLRRLADDGGRPRAIWLALGDAVLMLERRLKLAGPGPARAAHLPALAVHDLAAWRARLAAAGVAVADRTAHTLYVRDPDGHPVGLCDLAPWPPPGPQKVATK